MSQPDILDPSDWLTSNEVAELLGLSRAGMEMARAQGTPHPPWFKVGHRVRYRKSEVTAWLLSNRRTSAAEQLATA